MTESRRLKVATGRFVRHLVRSELVQFVVPLPKLA